LALKKFSRNLTKSGIRHTPLSLATIDAKDSPIHPTPLKLMALPQDLRDVDSIFGRYQRLSAIGRDFVKAQIIKMERLQ
jgi:hypothetical protein